jgi:hypothetical protein
MLDADADLTDASFSTSLVACGLYDLHDTSNEDSPPETYYRGKRKIDFCLGTMGIATSVTRAGITSNEEGLKFSDHQTLFIDINEEALFSSQGVDPTSCRSRGLWMKNKKAVKKYRDLFRSKLLAHNVFKRCKALSELPVGTDTSIVQHVIDTIDSEITKAALQAEQVTATRSFGYAWSPTLAKAGQRVTFWRNCLRSAKHCRDPFLHLIPSQLQHHGISHTGLRLSFYKSRLDDVWSNLFMVQDNSRELHRVFLATLMSDSACSAQKPRAAALNAIQQAEYLKKMWPKIWKYAKGETWSGLDWIEVPIHDSD